MVDADICNQALSHLGIGKEIGNLETERSAEAQACRRFYYDLRDKSLRDFPWPFATKLASLALVQQAPNSEWAYAYAYPTDCLKFRRIQSGLRTDSRQSRIPLRIFNSGTGRLILTDQLNAVGEYTLKVTDPNMFNTDFTFSLSLLLAGAIAPRLAAGDPFGLGKRAFELYIEAISRARANAIDEEQPDQETESEFIRAREGVEGADRRGQAWNPATAEQEIR